MRALYEIDVVLSTIEHNVKAPYNLSVLFDGY
jgi:hypothetical protein